MEAEGKGDWTAVARVIREELDRKGMSMEGLAGRSKVSITTVRELVRGDKSRQRRRRVLSEISLALGWNEDYLQGVCRGSSDTAPRSGGANSRIDFEKRRELTLMVADLKKETRKILASIEGRVAALEAKLKAMEADPPADAVLLKLP